MALAYQLELEQDSSDPAAEAARRLKDFLNAQQWTSEETTSALSGAAQEARTTTPASGPQNTDELLYRAFFQTGLEELALPKLKNDFRACFSARGESEKTSTLLTLLGHRDPEGVLRVALEEFDEHGNDDRIVLAADVLSRLGNRSVTALQSLADRRGPEAEYFVETAVRLARRYLDAPSAHVLLGQISLNPSDDVRERLAVALADAPRALAYPLLSKLASDDNDDVASAAEDALDELDA